VVDGLVKRQLSDWAVEYAPSSVLIVCGLVVRADGAPELQQRQNSIQLSSPAGC